MRGSSPRSSPRSSRRPTPRPCACCRPAPAPSRPSPMRGLPDLARPVRALHALPARMRAALDAGAGLHRPADRSASTSTAIFKQGDFSPGRGAAPLLLRPRGDAGACGRGPGPCRLVLAGAARCCRPGCRPRTRWRNLARFATHDIVPAPLRGADLAVDRRPGRASPRWLGDILLHQVAARRRRRRWSCRRSRSAPWRSCRSRCSR